MRYLGEPHPSELKVPQLLEFKRSQALNIQIVRLLFCQLVDVVKR